ncbi:hypothetical protein [Anaerovibrio sp.]|uniref:hypothetical protein n=1 Tax=Anaerovibrio sp. TaxID=1872532 RepID=UPI00388CF600
MKKIGICFWIVMTLLSFSSLAMATDLGGQITNVQYDWDKHAIVVDLKIENNNSQTVYLNGVDINFRIDNIIEENGSTSYEETASYDRINWCVPSGGTITQQLRLTNFKNTEKRFNSDTKLSAMWIDWDGALLDNSTVHYNTYYDGWTSEGGPSFKVTACSHSKNDYAISWSATIIQRSADGKKLDQHDCYWDIKQILKGMKEVETNCYTTKFKYVEGATYEITNQNLSYKKISAQNTNHGYRSDEDARVGRITGQSQSSIDFYRMINGLGPGEW